MQILKTKAFARDAKAQGLTDTAIKAAISEVEKGLKGDALGGNLYKKRVAIGSKGKSGGLRTILVFKDVKDKVFCIYVFAKNQKENIEDRELQALKKYGAEVLAKTEKDIKKAIDEKALLEVK